MSILIIGAGLSGSALAMHLAKGGAKDIRVIDLDLGGEWSSSELNAGGVRATWSTPLNIELSKQSIEYFEKHASDVGYRACGYLWLYGPDRFDGALKTRELQQSMGWEVSALSISDLRAQVPFIDKTDDLAGAIFAPRDGLVNPNLMKLHFRDEAQKRGARFEDRTLLRGVEYLQGGKVKVTLERFLSDLSSEHRRDLLTDVHPKDLKSETRVETFDQVVNCAGAWASKIASRLQYLCPSKPYRRQISVFDCRDVDLSPYGMIVDSSGVYFHPEATNGLAGFADPNEIDGFRFQYDGPSFFEEQIWARLYERSTAFERLRHLTGWAGLYEVSPDHSAIAGRVEQGEAGKSGCVFEAHSYSGHGVMQAYAVTRGIAELMLRGRYESLDLVPLSGTRFERGQTLNENWVI